jgi:hypothetical protein
LEFYHNFYDDLKEILQFTASLKDTLGHLEELQNNLAKLKKELEHHQKTVLALESGQTIASPDSFVGKLSKTIKEFTEGDASTSRHVVLARSKEIIPALSANMQSTATSIKNFEDSFSKELAYYDKMRIADWKNILKKLVRAQVDYYEKVSLSLDCILFCN